MRNSSHYRKSNEFVVSVQLDQASYDALTRLSEDAGVSKSNVVRQLIMRSVPLRVRPAVVDAIERQKLRIPLR